MGLLSSNTPQGPVPDAICEKCGDALFKAERACPSGHPAPWTTFSERNELEVQQWRSYKERVAQEEAS